LGLGGVVPQVGGVLGGVEISLITTQSVHLSITRFAMTCCNASYKTTANLRNYEIHLNQQDYQLGLKVFFKGLQISYYFSTLRLCDKIMTAISISK